MAASFGTPTPTTIRAAGPSPDVLVDKTALGNVVFEPTPEGMQVMAITFPAALGAMYAHRWTDLTEISLMKSRRSLIVEL